ncbi:hypothetical protein HCQ94_05100 [Actinomyces sp. zg-332]|uniref:hypothetical protein n=1 Tax=Actinomyces sp. zg-332 TaxID=2708340 RepID=UPI00141F67E1|nr:hypothetical protein [Actinomyces sp. zg-332]QPK93951.1 hypothetical protein HCQ94_05100 [Actinomyces sp. zg-332]
MGNVLSPTVLDIVWGSIFLLSFTLMIVAFVSLLCERNVFKDGLVATFRLLAIIFIPIIGPIYSIYLGKVANRNN